MPCLRLTLLEAIQVEKRCGAVTTTHKQLITDYTSEASDLEQGHHCIICQAFNLSTTYWHACDPALDCGIRNYLPPCPSFPSPDTIATSSSSAMTFSSYTPQLSILPLGDIDPSSQHEEWPGTSRDSLLSDTSPGLMPPPHLCWPATCCPFQLWGKGGPLNSYHHHGGFSHTSRQGERHTITLGHHSPNKTS